MVSNEQGGTNKAPNAERSTAELQPWLKRQRHHFRDFASDISPSTNTLELGDRNTCEVLQQIVPLPSGCSPVSSAAPRAQHTLSQNKSCNRDPMTEKGQNSKA